LNRIIRELEGYHAGAVKRPAIPALESFRDFCIWRAIDTERRYYAVKDDPEQEPAAFDALVLIRDVRDMAKAACRVPKVPSPSVRSDREATPHDPAAACSRFDDCSASLCPLQPEGRRGVHLPGEMVCLHLINSRKAGAFERFADDPSYAQAVERLPEIETANRDIARQVRRAGKYGFRRGRFSESALSA
jgi:hypothetical protein